MKKRSTRSLLAIAIEREHWELAALCIIADFFERLEKFPGSAESLIELMAEEGEQRRHSSRDRRRGRRR